METAQHLLRVAPVSQDDAEGDIQGALQAAEGIALKVAVVGHPGRNLRVSKLH